MKKLGISQEVFDFYVDMEKIRKVGRNKYEYDDNLEHQILDKGTVYKYSFNDNFLEDSREFIEQVKHTGKVRRFSKEEIKALEEKMKQEGRLNANRKNSK